jgi:hypothetical protein
MNRRQQAVIDYLLEENRILKEQFDLTGKKLRLDNRQLPHDAGSNPWGGRQVGDLPGSMRNRFQYRLGMLAGNAQENLG